MESVRLARVAISAIAIRYSSRFERMLRVSVWSSRCSIPLPDRPAHALVRSVVTDADLDLPEDLRLFSRDVWDAVQALVDDPRDGEAMARIALLREDYSRRHGYAVAMAMDEITAREASARQRARRLVRRERRRAKGKSAGGGGAPGQ